MIDWLVENSLGLYPVALERQVERMDAGKRNSEGVKKECSVSYILSIVPRAGKPEPATLLVRGYQWNDGIGPRIDFSTDLDAKDYYEVKDIRETRMTNFSCHGRTVLYIFITNARGKTTMYYAQFSGCYSLRDPKVPLYRVELFHKDGFYRIDKDPSHDMILKSINIRSKHQGLLHYCWSGQGGLERQARPELGLEIEGERYTVYGFRCIFCIKQFKDISSLAFHISYIHSGYKCIQSEGSLLLRKDSDSLQSCRTLVYFSRKYKRKRLTPGKVQDVSQRYEGSVNGIWSMESLLGLANKGVRASSALPENTLALMEKWNALRLHGGMFLDDVARFAKQERKNPSIVNFLLVLYHKSVVDPKELMELVYSLFEDD
ncbi:hypothetical protein EHEL_011090 [Encephalitozoon hellem ATCC 50504]|uniref:FeS cluster assembly protein n=1 Tax=Encephalitozoon hellem TaxID=27973 RepID=A0A9Q9CAG6_ENCHE|nr:uncharacterized protein EHEL_011090 [Encephalitozoon hellem ATCC 50504]AFM97732.1 hypothetical protein EHEL_011090 [Encephalitozoon hellem ATCC 50504]UTX42424.1 FeS cluster assembly protein [Encephalitozoon hellem]WEL37867.1 FeS cluster assembly protein [Encephalitozoon hellem]|eukprot:XP_003886713.1 hypothetical protein EHEL_011090 [Encephalitozoon hellem ATCC 50504]